MTDNNAIKAQDGLRTLFGMDMEACVKSARSRATRTHKPRAVFLADGDYLHMAYGKWSEKALDFVCKVNPWGPLPT